MSDLTAVKKKAIRVFGGLNGYSAAGTDNGKVVIYVTENNSACAKATIPREFAGKVVIRKASNN